MAEPALPIRALSGRLPGLDALRALAAVVVLLSHLADVAWLGTVPPVLDDASADTLGIITHAAGAWGVGIFFVLSGVCIHLPQARRSAVDKDAGLFVRDYLKKRFLRIYPPHLVVLFASIAVASFLPVLPPDAQLLSVPTLPQTIAHLFLVHSFGPEAISSGNAVLWTIAVESHFYLLYPLLLRWRGRWPWLAIVGALLAGSILLALAAQHWFADYAWLAGDTFAARIWEWALGCWLAERLVAQGVGRRAPLYQLPLLIFASLAFGWFSLNDERAIALLPWLWPLFAVAIVAAGARLRMSPGLINRAVLAIGRSSYSLYLTHTIALVGLAGLLGASRSPALNALIELAGAALLCSLFFRWVESPFLRRSKSSPTVDCRGSTPARTVSRGAALNPQADSV